MRLSRSLLVGGLTFAVSTLSARAATIYVNAAATGSNDGSSWSNAYTSLRSGLTAAASGDEIWVAAATYLPTTTADRTVNFQLKNGVGVYGGFNGTETMRDQRNPAVNVTILSGDIGSPGDSSDNSYHVVTADAAVTASGVLDGFTITGGNASGSSPDDRGGGMWDNSGAPTIGHCIFTANSAQERGGGLRVTTGMPVLDGCVFESNSAAVGGGGVFAGSGSTLLVKNTIFRSNSTVSTGGGGLEAVDNVSVVNSVFLQNSGNGAAFLSNGSVSDCTFTLNSSYGVAFFTDGSAANSVLWGDAVGEVFPGIGTIAITYSDVQGGWIGTGNINADPLFVNAGGGDLRLGPGSPAVDAGSNAAVPAGITTDITGLPRFFDDPDVPDTGAGTPPIVDMGAHERVPLSVTDPASQTVCAGTGVSLSVTAMGQAPLSYQWRKNTVNLSDGGSVSGSTTPTLTISPTVTGDSGTYDVVVTDAFLQTVTSAAATLTVNPLPIAAASGSAAICAGGSTPLSGSGGVSCSWAPATGLSDPNSCNPSASPASTTTYTLTVTDANGCVSTNNPTVTVTVNPLPPAPTITAPSWAVVGATGIMATVPNNAGSTYAWTVSGGTITGGQGSSGIVFDAGPPGTTMALSVVETPSAGCPSAAGTATVQVDFLDVPPTHPFHDFVDTIARDGITAGCGVGNYCPDNPVTRAQMAVFLLRAEHGSSYAPPACSGLFTDVPCPGGFAVDWIEQLSIEGVTAGCGGGNYCPDNPVTRAQMAVFLLRAEHGSGYTPPACAGIFQDVACMPTPAFAVDWIEQLYAEGVTGGCSPSPLLYCPDDPNTRGQMAVFLVKALNLP